MVMNWTCQGIYIVMPLTSKKLKGQIGLGLFVCPSIYPPPQKKKKKTIHFLDFDPWLDKSLL